MIWSLPDSDTYFAPMLDERGFQIDHLERALSYCKQFRRAIDGGAHIGTWSLAMSERFENVLAFEPAPDTFACLIQNTEGRINITRFQMALGAEPGFAEIVDDPARTGNTGARHLDHVGDKGSVQVIRLDPFGLNDLDFLKLDVEGYELPALQGARETIERCRPVVLIEAKKFNPQRFGIDVEAASQFLLGLGYRMVEQIKRDRIFVHG